MEKGVDAPIIDSITNEDNIFILLEKNNKSEQENDTNIISDNTESNKVTFLQMLK